MNVSREDVVVSALSSLLAEMLVETEDFHHCERQGLQNTLNLFCRAYEQALDAFDDFILAENDPRFESKGKESRLVFTTAGPVLVNRRRYKSETGSVYLLDEALDLPPRF